MLHSFLKASHRRSQLLRMQRTQYDNLPYNTKSTMFTKTNPQPDYNPACGRDYVLGGANVVGAVPSLQPDHL